MQSLDDMNNKKKVFYLNPFEIISFKNKIY